MTKTFKILQRMTAEKTPKFGQAHECVAALSFFFCDLQPLHKLNNKHENV